MNLENTHAPGAENSGLRHFVDGIMDLRFGRYLSMQLLPIFYLLLLVGAAFVIVALVGVAFWFSTAYGLVALAMAPVAWLVVAAIARAALEFLVMAYRIMHTVQSMGQVAEHVAGLSQHIGLLQERLEGITGNMQDIHAGFGEIRHDIRKVSGQVDTIYTVVELAEPVLKPLVAAQRLVRGRGRKA